MIKTGQHLPDATFKVMTADGPKDRSTGELFKGRRAVLFAVPGAFTPTCHRNHLPGFIENADKFFGKGIDAIYVTAVNDVFVMDAWEKASKAGGKIVFLADGSGDFAKAIGMTLDASVHGLGLRSQRYSMLVNDGVVEKVNLEDVPGQASTSGAENLLGQI